MGFAQEMKDFLSASEKTIKTLSDSSYHKAMEAESTERTTKSREDRLDPLTKEEKEIKVALLRNRLKAATATAALEAAPRVGPTMPDDYAQPGGRATKPPQAAAPAETPEQPYFAKGGLVKKFAYGGEVEEEPTPAGEQYAPPPQTQRAPPPQLPQGVTDTPAVGGAPTNAMARVPLPAQRPAMAAGPAIGGAAIGGTEGDDELTGEGGALPATDMSSRTRRPTATVGTGEYGQAPKDAVNEGMKYGAQNNQVGGVNSAAADERMRRWITGAGGPPPADMHKIYKKIDPDGTMGESERNLAAINSVYQFYYHSGREQMAQHAASMMLQYYRTSFSQYSAIAKAALQGGNADASTKALMKAYANVPDGSDVKLWTSKDGSVNYEFKNEKGEPVQSGLMSPREYAASLMKVNPATFDQLLLTKAGKQAFDAEGNALKAAGRKGAVEAGGKEPKISDQKTIKEEVGSHVDAVVADLAKKPDGPQLTNQEANSIKNVMFRMRKNNTMTDDEAYEATSTFIRAPEPKKGEPPPFKVTKSPEEGIVRIRYPDGRIVEMDEDEYGPMRALRVKALAEKAQKQKLAEIEAAKPGYGDIAMKGVAAAGRLGERVGGTLANAASHPIDTAGNVLAVPARAAGAVVNDPGMLTRPLAGAAKYVEENLPNTSAALRRAAAKVGGAVGAVGGAAGALADKYRGTPDPTRDPDYTVGSPL